MLPVPLVRKTNPVWVLRTLGILPLSALTVAPFAEWPGKSFITRTRGARSCALFVEDLPEPGSGTATAINLG